MRALNRGSGETLGMQLPLLISNTAVKSLAEVRGDGGNC